MPDAQFTENPDFDLVLGNSNVFTKKLTLGVKRLVEHVSFEDCDGIADMMKIVLKNPDGILTDNKLFMPGNEVSMYAGYDGNMGHVGRARIYKVRPDFPRDEMPTLTVTGYSRDHELMHNSPPQATTAGPGTGASKAKRQQTKDGRIFDNVKYSEAVNRVAGRYGFATDIDTTPTSPSIFNQKAGMSDYDFVNGLANINGFVFWVDGDEQGNWTLHFKDPEKLKEQDAIFTFERNKGNLSTLFEFRPEFLVSEAIAQIRVRVLNPRTGLVIESNISEDSDAGSPDMDLTTSDDIKDEDVEKSPDQGLSVQLFIGDYTFYEIANRRFETEAQLAAFAKQWFRRNRENFIYADAETIGINTIRSRQIHKFKGAGTMYDGNYYISRARHVVDGRGYTLDITARKQASTGT